MTVEFSCPECDKVYTLPSRLAGKMARCKQCDTVMIVPGAVESEIPPPAPPLKPPPNVDPPVRKSSSKKTRKREPEPADPFGVEDIAPLPPRFEDAPAADWGAKPRKKKRKSGWGDDVPRPQFGHCVLAWFLLMLGLLGGAFAIEDGPYRCGQLMVWMGLILVPVGSIWFTATAFMEGMTQGLLLLFVPFYSLYHLFSCWSTTYRPFAVGILATISLVSGALLYGSLGDDVGERALLSVPGSRSSQRVVIDEKTLTLRPPDITEDMPEDKALEQWESFLTALDQQKLWMIVEKKKKVMSKNHGKGSFNEVHVTNIMDGATFDAVATSLRKHAGPGADDFFVYSVRSRGKTAKMVAMISPALDPRALLGAIDFGQDKMVATYGGGIVVNASVDSVPSQLRALCDFKEEDEKTRLARLAGRKTAPTAEPTPYKEAPPTPPRTLTSVASTGDLELPFPSNLVSIDNTIYPITNSRFVAIGDNSTRNSYRESWDLRTRRRIGLIQGAIPGTHFALSPDGLSMVAVSSGMQSVEIWSFETGQLVRRIDVNTIVNWVDFAGPDRVLIFTPFQNTFYLCEIATGRTSRRIASPVLIEDDSLAVSLDFKSLALASTIQKSAGLYSLETAKLTANWVVPPTQPFGSMSCKGMAFSPDGTELAALFEDSKFARFMAWGPGGKILTNAVVPLRTPESVAKPSGYRGRTLEWLPDQNGWLVYGQGIVDRQTGKRAWTIPEASTSAKSAPKRITENGDLMFVGGTSTRPILKSTPLPLNEIAQAIREIRPGP